MNDRGELAVHFQMRRIRLAEIVVGPQLPMLRSYLRMDGLLYRCRLYLPIPSSSPATLSPLATFASSV